MSAIRAIAKVGTTPNPFANEPIPDYVRAWDDSIRRPTMLPDCDYGNVADDCVFWLPDADDEGGGSYIAPDRCTWCKRLKKPCSRTRPVCGRCQNSPSRCDITAVAWAFLRKSKGPKTSALHSAPQDNSLSQDIHNDIASAGPSSTLATAAPGPAGVRKSKARSCKLRLPPTAYLPPGLPDEPGRSQCKFSSKRRDRKLAGLKQALYIKIKAARPKAVSTSSALSRRALSKPSAISKKRKTEEVPSAPSKRRKPKQASAQDGTGAVGDASTKHDVNDSYGEESKRVKTVTRGRYRNGKARTREAAAIAAASGQSSGWHVVLPTDINEGAVSSDCRRRLGSASLLPKIWASSKAELCRVLPALAHDVNGVTWHNTEAPVVFIEGAAWPTDNWDGGRIIELSMIRQFEGGQLGSEQHPATAQVSIGPSAEPVRPEAPLPSPDIALSSLYALAADGEFSNMPDLTPDNSFATDSTDNSILAEPFDHSFPDSAGLLTLTREPSVLLDSMYDPPTTEAQGTSSYFHPSLFLSPPPSRRYEHPVNGYSALGMPHPASITLGVFGCAPTAPAAETPWPMDFQATHNLSNFVPYESSPPCQADAELPFQMDGSNPSDGQVVNGPVQADTQDALSHEPVHQSLDTLASPPAPPEIDVLLRSHSLQIPVSLIACKGSGLMPFGLPEPYEHVFLGYFNIVDVRVTNLDPSSPNAPTRICWSFKFEWIPGGESMDPAEWSQHPWWMPPCAEDTPDLPAQLFGPLLPLELLAASISTNDELDAGTSEVGDSRGWLCQGCGKLNAQNCLRFQKCDNCQRANNLLPVDVDCVRNPFAVAVQAYPWNRHTSSVVQTQTKYPNGMRIIRYDTRRSAGIGHFFTGNIERLQEVPTKLFRDLQMNLEMPMRGVKGGLTSGACFSYLVGDAQEGGVVPWAEAPHCISTAKDLIDLYVKLEHDDNSAAAPAVRNLTVLGWTNSGTRKGAFSARTALLCLGADLEISILAKPHVPPHTAPEVVSGMGEDSHRVEQEVATTPRHAAGITPSGSASSKVALEELLMVTLVHGDMLVVEGGALQHSMKRTGMNIVIIGTS